MSVKRNLTATPSTCVAGQLIGEITVSIDRKADQIEEKLRELSDYTDEHGLEGLCVVCEPTGGYDEELLRLARQQGHETAYVNTEHSAKMSSVESGDTNKTDPADARAMSLVAQVDRTQTHRALEGEYGLLRELGQMYEDEDRQATRARTRFHHVLKRLFCDYEKDADFLFDSTGTAAGGGIRLGPGSDRPGRVRAVLRADQKPRQAGTVVDPGGPL